MGYVPVGALASALARDPQVAGTITAGDDECHELFGEIAIINQRFCVCSLER